MIRLLYNCLLYLLLPVILLRLAYRGLRATAYLNRVPERFGVLPTTLPRGVIWVHAVSVGETIAAAPLVEHFLACGNAPVLVTTMTPTGSERVRALFGDRVWHVYAPYDYPGAVSRFLKRVQPAVAVIMETEIWPNLVCKTAQRGIPVLLANARLSERSARGYRRLAPLSRLVFSNLHAVMAQGPADAARFAALGVEPDRLTVTGSMKFDIELDTDLVTAASKQRQQLGSRPVWIAASTHAGEDELVLATHARLLREHPALLLILVPRHPERFSRVARLIDEAGLVYCKRSTGEMPVAEHQVLLGDTMGDLLFLYGLSDIALVGGSFVDRGGHNPLEPAAWQLPILTGASDFNFADVYQKLDVAGARRGVADADGLYTAMSDLLSDDGTRQDMGHAARAVVDANRGALQTQIAIIETARAGAPGFGR